MMKAVDPETKRQVLVACAGAAASVLAAAAVEMVKHLAKPLWNEFGPRKTEPKS